MVTKKKDFAALNIKFKNVYFEDDKKVSTPEKIPTPPSQNKAKSPDNTARATTTINIDHVDGDAAAAFVMKAKNFKSHVWLNRAKYRNGGGNGKGTLTKLLIILLNDYVASVPVTAVIKAGRLKDAGVATTELNVLEKCRLAIVEELPQGGRLDVAKFKSLTGGDKIPVRKLHEEFHNIDPTHKLMLSGNHMPILSDTRDPGLLRRLLNMLFSADFTKNPDTLLKKKLLAPDSSCRHALSSRRRRSIVLSRWAYHC